jgi:hypothetical protein
MEALWLAFASKMCDPAWLKCEEAAEQVEGKNLPTESEWPISVLSIT